MSNYPDNVDPRSPDCPWNEKDPVMVECPECEGAGRVEDPQDEEMAVECDICNGTGRIEISEEDLKEIEADRKYDEWKDDQL